MQQMATIKPEFRINLEQARGENFEELFLGAIDSVFSEMGNQSKQAMYGYLERVHGIRRDEIPAKMDAFVAAVEEVFGQASRLIEIQIMQALHRKVSDFKFAESAGSLSFEAYVRALRLSL